MCVSSFHKIFRQDLLIGGFRSDVDIVLGVDVCSEGDIDEQYDTSG